MDIKTALDSFLTEIKNDFIIPLASQVVDTEFVSPPNSFKSEKILKAEKMHELIAFYSAQEITDRVAMGFDAIVNDLQIHLSPSQFDTICKEIQLGIEVMLARVSSKEKTPEDPELSAECMQEVMGISEETLKEFYAVGNRFFNHQQYEQAAAAFFAAICLDHRRVDFWVAFALSEARSQHLESAIDSLNMAALIDPTLPHPYLYATECCLRNHQVQEAKAYLSLAREAVDKSGEKQKWRELIAHYQQLCS